MSQCCPWQTENNRVSKKFNYCGYWQCFSNHRCLRVKGSSHSLVEEAIFYTLSLSTFITSTILKCAISTTIILKFWFFVITLKVYHLPSRIFLFPWYMEKTVTCSLNWFNGSYAKIWEFCTLQSENAYHTLGSTKQKPIWKRMRLQSQNPSFLLLGRQSFLRISLSIRTGNFNTI